MPEDNEVDEKAVAWLITYTERDGSKRQAVYTHNAIADWRMFDPAATSEPLYSAATVAELRAEVERLRAERQASLGVGDGSGQLIVHGKYDSIKECQRKLLAGEAAERRVAAALELAEKWEDKAADSWGEDKDDAARQQCCDELRATLTGADPT